MVADVLSVAGVRGTVAATVEAGGSWGLGVDRHPHASFHALVSGAAWLRSKGRKAVRLMPGDVVLLPTGMEHGLSSGPDTRLTPFTSIRTEPDSVIALGTGPVSTRILCARYWHDRSCATPLFQLLPEVLHVSASSMQPGLQETIRLLGWELGRQEVGGTTVLDRLVDILLIQLLREWMYSQPEEVSVSWLGGRADPTVAAARAAIHSDPARPWSVASLAEAACVSRSTLARRFEALVGQSPATYLTEWRMNLAARELRESDASLEAIARLVGYRSQFAFSRAFSRARGCAPSQYRRSQRSQ